MTTRCREFIAAERQAGSNVAKACDLLEVSRSAFYDWHEHPPSVRALSDAELTEKVRAVHLASKGTYGAPRVHAELAAQGLHVGRKRVARLMVGGRPGGTVPSAYPPHHRCRPRSQGDELAERGVRAGEHRHRHGLGRRYHLCPHLGGLGLPGHRDRPGQPQSGGLGDGRPYGVVPCLPGDADGPGRPSARPRAPVPFRPRKSRRIPAVVATPQ